MNGGTKLRGQATVCSGNRSANVNDAVRAVVSAHEDHRFAAVGADGHRGGRVYQDHLRPQQVLFPQGAANGLPQALSLESLDRLFDAERLRYEAIIGSRHRKLLKNIWRRHAATIQLSSELAAREQKHAEPAPL